jgi:hypothetical protein
MEPANVLQLEGSPLSKPLLNQRRRCSEEPCVQRSGLTWPWVASWIRSSPTAAAASSASLMSVCVMSYSSPVFTAFAAQTPA